MNKKRTNAIIILSMVTILILALAFYKIGTSKKESLVFITKNKEVRVNVEIADTLIEHTKGLMYRTSLDENLGMLFIFQEEATRSFWMKNTYLSLDIIFVNSNFEIIKIAKNAQPCTKDPCDKYSSDSPIKYIVEVNGGFTEREGIEIGDKIKIN